MKKILAVLVLLLSLVLCLASCNATKYDDALALIEDGKYEEALVEFNYFYYKT